MTAPDRTLLRKLEPARDGEALHAIFGDPQSCLYMAAPAFATIEETIAALTRWTQDCEETSWAIVDDADGPALGRVSMIPRGGDIWEAACMVVPDARGRGLARAGLAAALDRVFGVYGARRVFADIDPDNAASIRTFERLGFRREGLLRATWKTHIGVRDSIIMALLDADPRPWR